MTFKFGYSLILLIAIGVGFTEGIAAPVEAITNTGVLSQGGSPITDVAWKALVFKTPSTASAEIVSIQLGLNCNGSVNCPDANAYQVTVKLQIDLYSVQNGVPRDQLYSIPLQNVILTEPRQTYTFSLPNWRLSAGTDYAVVLKSTSANKLKWSNVNVDNADHIPTGLNGFTFINFRDTGNAGTSWSIPPAQFNGVVINAILFSPQPNPIPTLSEWAQIMMMLAMIATAGFYGWRMKQP